MVTDAETIVIGSGPAGVSAAWPLVEAGRPVLMMEAGLDRVRHPDPRHPPLSVLRDVGFASPKLRTATPVGFGEDFLPGNAIHAEGFRAVGALAVGGLSNVWGAVACAYGPDDMAGWPISAEDLAPSFRRVAARIGISGDRDGPMGALQGDGHDLQPPLDPGEGPARLLERWRAGPQGGGFLLGRPRNAVLSLPHAGRPGCGRDQDCMWGCRLGAAYNAADEIAALQAHAGFRLETGLLVERLEAWPSGGWRVLARDRRGGGEVWRSARRVVLAAGTLASARLGLAALGHLGRERPLITAPAFAFALLQPGLLGRPLPANGFGMVHLAFAQILSERPGDRLFGSLYTAQSFALSDMIAGLPLTRRGACAAMRALLPGLMVGLAYFPGGYSANRLRLDPDGVMRIRGGNRAGFRQALAGAVRGLNRGFRAAGAMILPGSVRAFEPGAEVHYAGPLAMGELSGSDGGLLGAEGLYVADGAALPGLSAKHHTFTVMANADRIGRLLAART